MTGIVHNPTACLQCSILAPTNAQVDIYNNAILHLLNSTSHQYNAVDMLEEHTEAVEMVNLNSNVDPNSPLPNPNAILDYIQYQHRNGMPDYNLTVKVGGVYHLLQNFSIDLGLVKNIQVVVIGLGSKLITIHPLQGTQTPRVDPGNILLPCITFKD